MLNIIAGSLSVGAPPAPPNSYESIASTTVGSGGTASITFSSISSSYTHLQIRGILKSNRTSATANGWAWLTVNGSQGARYHYVYGNGSSVVAGADVPSTGVGGIIVATGSASGANDMFSGVVIDILDYANTNKNKTLRIFSGADINSTFGYAMLSSYLVNSTNAITSITIGGVDDTNLQQYSSLALYGIKGS